jgi:hypothetical protein
MSLPPPLRKGGIAKHHWPEFYERRNFGRLFVIPARCRRSHRRRQHIALGSP